MLLWTLLIFTVTFSLLHFVSNTAHKPIDKQLTVMSAMPLMALFSAPLSGWLADAKLGNYKVFRFGVVLLFISTVLNCLLLVLEELT